MSWVAVLAWCLDLLVKLLIWFLLLSFSLLVPDHSACQQMIVYSSRLICVQSVCTVVHEEESHRFVFVFTTVALHPGTIRRPQEEKRFA